MNGIHDMGGMHGMGPIVHEKSEPTFHQRWEGRVYAITRVLRAAGGRQNIDNARHLIELQPPAEYLRRTYYERWLERLVDVLLANKTITREELESGKPAPGSPKATPGDTTTPDFSTISVANCMLPSSRNASGSGAQANIEASGGGIVHPARPKDSTSASRRLR